MSRGWGSTPTCQRTNYLRRVTGNYRPWMKRATRTTSTSFGFETSWATSRTTRKQLVCSMGQTPRIRCTRSSQQNPDFVCLELVKILREDSFTFSSYFTGVVTGRFISDCGSFVLFPNPMPTPKERENFLKEDRSDPKVYYKYSILKYGHQGAYGKDETQVFFIL